MNDETILTLHAERARYAALVKAIDRLLAIVDQDRDAPPAEAAAKPSDLKPSEPVVSGGRRINPQVYTDERTELIIRLADEGLHHSEILGHVNALPGFPATAKGLTWKIGELRKKGLIMDRTHPPLPACAAPPEPMALPDQPKIPAQTDDWSPSTPWPADPEPDEPKRLIVRQIDIQSWARQADLPHPWSLEAINAARAARGLALYAEPTS